MSKLSPRQKLDAAILELVDEKVGDVRKRNDAYIRREQQLRDDKKKLRREIEQLKYYLQLEEETVARYRGNTKRYVKVTEIIDGDEYGNCGIVGRNYKELTELEYNEMIKPKKVIEKPEEMPF